MYGYDNLDKLTIVLVYYSLLYVHVFPRWSTESS